MTNMDLLQPSKIFMKLLEAADAAFRDPKNNRIKIGFKAHNLCEEDLEIIEDLVNMKDYSIVRLNTEYIILKK